MALRWDATQLDGLVRGIRRLTGAVLRLAAIGAAGAVAIAILLARGGFSFGDALATALLLAPPLVLVLFAQGVRELLTLPERLRKMPAEGQERFAELTRVAGGIRSARTRALPLQLWRLRGAVGSLRGVASVALPLRVLTPPFLGLTALAALLCVALAAAGLIALLVLAVG